MANNKLVTVDVLQYNNEKIKEQLNKKVNIAQGVDNKDKILQVNEEGNLALVDMPDEVKVSAEEGNAITSKDDGLYVPSVSETKISAEEGNAIISKDDGIYVAPTDLSDYYKKDETYSRTEVDDAITNAQLGGEEVDLSEYIKEVEADEKYVLDEEIKVYTEDDITALFGLSEEELEGITQLISDTEVRIDKTYSSSKIYSELNRILEEGKTYTLEEIAKKSGASYKIATATADMISTEYIYLLANGDTYDMYICEEENSTPVKIGSTEIDLTDYLTTEIANQTYVLKTVFEALSNNIGNVENLTTDDKTVVGAINEIDKAVSEITNGTTAVPKATNADTVDGWHIYSGLAEIGLSGSVTMTDVIAAMPNKSELRFTNNTDNPNCVSDVPGKYGFLIIKKNLYVEATWIAVNRKTTVPMYFGSWHSDNGWTGWSNSDTSHLSNPNLLDNSNFAINQRGQDSYTSNNAYTYTVDRWYFHRLNPTDLATVTLSDNGISISTIDITYDYIEYVQKIETYSFNKFAGKQFTLSVETDDGILSATGKVADIIYTSSTRIAYITDSLGVLYIFAYMADSSSFAVFARIPKGLSVNIHWMKLEMGTTATQYCPPNYAEELLKIQTMTDDGNTRLVTNNSMPLVVNSQMISNPNLLDNPDFSINQRGLTEYEVSSKTYTVDRWKTANVPSLIVTGDKQITIQRHPSQSSSFSSLGQVIEKLSKGTYTFSIDIVSIDESVPAIVMRAMDWADIANGVSGTYYAIKNIDNSAGDVAGRCSLTFTLPEDKENVYIYIYGANLATEDAKFTIANAKLEVGSVATPYVAPHPAEELAKCQRYYQTLGNEISSRQAIVCIAQSPSWAPLGHVFPVEMKRQPTVTLTYLAKWNKSSESLDLDTTATLHNVTSKGIANLWSESNLLETSNAYYVKYTASAEL